jgi:cytoskeletal protein RodZ
VTDRGKHVRRTGSQFYKDVLLLIAGILLVGALVFGGLSLLAGGNGDTTTTTSSIPETTSSTEFESDTTAASPSTSTIPNTTSTSTPETTTTAAPTTTERQARPVNEVTVIVLNSTEVDGLAGELSNAFADAGYVTLEAANYEPTLDATTVFHAEGFALEAAEARDLVEDPDATVAADPELAQAQGADVVVVLGQSYDG